MIWNGYPQVGVARLTAISDVLKTEITLLDDMIAEVAETYAIAEVLRPLTTDHVHIGATERLWKTDEMGFLHMFVSAGTDREGVSSESEWQYIGQGAKSLTFHTSISIEIHPEWIAQADHFAQAEAREVVLCTVDDWVRVVFNDPILQHQQLSLGSYEFRPAAGGVDCDKFTGLVASTFKGQFQRSFGQAEAVWGIRATHRGIIG